MSETTNQTAEKQDLMTDVENLQVALEESQRLLRESRAELAAMLANRDYWTGLYTAEREKRLAAEKDSARLSWHAKDIAKGDDGIGIYYEGGRYRLPYMVSNAGGFGGGVGEANFVTLTEAIDAAIAQEAGNG